MADSDKGRARLQQSNLENARKIADAATCDATYSSAYSNFVKWVKECPDLDTEEAPFIMTTNVDHYFSREILKKRGTKNTINRIVNALEWYAVHKEIVPHLEQEILGHVFEPLEKHLRDRPMVSNALARQYLFEMNAKPANPGSDPHKGLKDILSVEECHQCMNFIYNDNDWGALGIHFLYGQNGAIRGHSNRNLKYCDIKVSRGFGPEEGIGALLVIIRKGKNIRIDMNKTNK